MKRKTMTVGAFDNSVRQTGGVIELDIGSVPQDSATSLIDLVHPPILLISRAEVRGFLHLCFIPPCSNTYSYLIASFEPCSIEIQLPLFGWVSGFASSLSWSSTNDSDSADEKALWFWRNRACCFVRKDGWCSFVCFLKWTNLHSLAWNGPLVAWL